MQTLSGRLPWSEIKNFTIIIIKLYEKCLPQRPESLPIFDAHWDFIMLCMSLVAEFRPSVVEVLEWVNGVISLREFPCLTLSYITLVSLVFEITDRNSAGSETENPPLHSCMVSNDVMCKFPSFTLSYISLVSLLSFTGCNTAGPETENPQLYSRMALEGFYGACEFPCFTFSYISLVSLPS